MWKPSIVGALLASPASADPLHDLLAANLVPGKAEQFISIMRDHPEDQEEITRWLKQRVDSGQAPDEFVQLLVPILARNKKINDALIYLNYFRSLIIIDGVICKDDEHQGTVLKATIFVYGRLIDDKIVTVEQKRDAAERAIKLENATSAIRKRDLSLCGPGHNANATTPEGNRYADDPLWRVSRGERLKELRRLLFAMSGVLNP